MSFISNKILHSVSTTQNMATKEERGKSVLSSSFLNIKLSQRIKVGTGSKQSINWPINNDSNSFPLMNYFTNHNNLMVGEIQSSLTQLEIIMDRIQNKAMTQQASIQVVYKQLKELERILTVQLKDIDSSNQQSDKQQMKNILTKIKSLFVTVSEKLHESIDFRQPVNYFRQEQNFQQTRIDQTFPNLFQSENKERQKQWQQQIDSLSQTMFDLESELRQLKNQSIARHKLFEEEINILQGNMIGAIMVIYCLKKEEKSIVNYQHDVIMQLIHSAVEKLTYL